MVTGTPRSETPHPPGPLSDLRWRRVFPGHRQELSAVRRWLSSLLPDCPARDDVLSVATELGSNAIQHTASGQGGWFAVEISCHGPVLQVVVADCGGPGEPRVIDDQGGERGRGLRLVRGRSVETGYSGDHHGRLVWAQIAWADPGPVPSPVPQPYRASVPDVEVRPAGAASLVSA